jgi:hypothetical protein
MGQVVCIYPYVFHMLIRIEFYPPTQKTTGFARG